MLISDHLRYIFLTMVSASYAAFSSATGVEEKNGVVESISADNSLRPGMLSPLFTNPAQYQWKDTLSLTSISVGGRRDNLNRPIDPARGKGERYWEFNAGTYTKYKSSTLWGEAYYRNCKQYDVVWNETSDPELIYPYLTVDAVGGDLKGERYFFSGGYADHSGKWFWGTTLSYLAGLYYRNVDPRPRNITGSFDIAAGGGILLGNYAAGISFSYRKYKQNSEIDFKSELGVETIYHPTGLGTLYKRFSGLGYDTYYTGNRFGGSVSLAPTNAEGFTMTASFSRFSFNKILTELNKLPMAHVWHNELTLQGGYLGKADKNSFILLANFYAYRRHGRENYFGDPALSIYPLIGSLEMYADNYRKLSIDLEWKHDFSRSVWVELEGEGGWDHRSQIYLEPARFMKHNLWELSLNGKGFITFAEKWMLIPEFSFYLSSPLSSDYSGSILNSEPAGLGEAELIRHNSESGRSLGYHMNLEAIYSFNSSNAIGIGASWNTVRYADDIHGHNISLSVNYYLR